MATPHFEIRPLGLWGRPVTNPRAGSGRFRASWDSTLALLLREVEMLDGGVVVLQVDADPTEIRRDGMLRARARVGFPGVKVSFDSRHGPLTYATDAYDQWQANVRAIALALESLRAVDRYGVTSTGEQYRGWTAIADKPAEKTLTLEDAVRILAAEAPGVTPADLHTVDAINRAFRAASRRHHPDAGGSADAFRLISNARDILLKAAGAHPTGGASW